MNFSMFAKCLKKIAKNKKISDEIFVNALLSPYVLGAGIENKNGEEFYLNKSRVSLLLNCNDDIPQALRDALSQPDIYKWTESKMNDFIEDYLDPSAIPNAIGEIIYMLKKEENIKDKKRLLELSGNVSVFLAYTLIETIKLRNDICNDDGVLLRNGCFSLKVIYDDIFKYAFRKRSKDKCICVIPVDTEFHTHVTRKYEDETMPQVSEKSIHGQWLIRWEQSGEDSDNLYSRIIHNIRNYDGDLIEGIEYPLGTISVLESGNTVYYLIAISVFDENNNAHSTPEEIKRVIDELAEFYDKFGQGCDIYIPLLGTGKSRAGISLQESYNMIVQNYKRNVSRIQGNIKIIIHKDFEGEIKTEV